MKRTVEAEILARRKRTAEEILDALTASGMSRKEFALKMGRQPSEVTKWLSGKHNFTSDLLAEISAVLSCPISGAEDRVQMLSGVKGYGSRPAGSPLREPDCLIGGIELPADTTMALMGKAKDAGVSLREYIRTLLCEKAAEKPVSAFDFNGIWAAEGPDIDEIRSLRTHNTIKEL